MVSMLVVDDEQDVERLFLQRFRKELKTGDVKMKFAFNGENALNFLRTLEPCDLVISDINMPGMTGLDLLRSIRQEFPGLKVMIVTAYGDEKNFQSAISNGADEFFTKPVDFTALKEKIKALVY